MSNTPSIEFARMPSGEFMTPIPLAVEQVRLVPHSAGCYFIYLEDQPFYAGMSTCSIRNRLLAHAAGRGSKQVRSMLASGRPMYFEYLDAYPSEPYSAEVIAGTEFVFMMLHTGRLLPGNMRADNYRHFGEDRALDLLLKDYSEEAHGALITAQRDVLIVDMYMDPDLISRYLKSIDPKVSVRLLVGEGADAPKRTLDLVGVQFPHTIELRSTASKLYGHFLFLDGVRGFRAGSSWRVGERMEPARLMEMFDDPRMSQHEGLWSAATRLQAARRC